MAKRTPPYKFPHASVNMCRKKILTTAKQNQKLHLVISALRISVFYGAFGTLWIIFSGKAVQLIAKDLKAIHTLELYKGWIFVFLSTISLFFLIYKNLSKYETTRNELHDNYYKLNKAHKELLRLKEKLSSLAYIDKLTELPNKVSFESTVNHMIQKHPKAPFAFIYMDIDNFKNINDILGHETGDEFLRQIGAVLKQNIQEPDIAARLGGDEFAILLNHTTSDNGIQKFLENLLPQLRKVWVIKNHDFFVTFSIGITLYPNDGDTVSRLFRNGDTAMYSVKKSFKDSIAYYSNDIMEKNLRRIDMINSLRKAVANKEFFLLFQPIKSLNTGSLIGVEALIRWKHPKKGLVSPMEFIPLAEESGLIYDIDKWVLEAAFLQVKEWTEKNYPPIKMSINISGSSLKKEGLVEYIQFLLRNIHINREQILLEVTETSLIENLDISIGILKRIRNMGIRIALDDFGTGYSSLTYLEKLPIDIVKLDRSFIKNMFLESNVGIIVETIIRLTHELLLEITAEGIETPAQWDYLKEKQCDYGQGYLLSKPAAKEYIESHWN